MRPPITVEDIKIEHAKLLLDEYLAELRRRDLAEMSTGTLQLEVQRLMKKLRRGE